MLERNHLKRPEGDAVNAILTAAGHNLRPLIAWMKQLLAFLLAIVLIGAAKQRASNTTTT